MGGRGKNSKCRAGTKRQRTEMKHPSKEGHCDSNDEATSPALRSPTKQSSDSSKKMTNVPIEISSSHDSIKKSHNNEDKWSERTKSEVANNKDQNVLDKIDQLGSNVEDMRQVVHALTNIIMTQSPNIMPVFSPISPNYLCAVASGFKTPTDVPLMMNPYTTPKHSSLTNHNAIDFIIEKLRFPEDGAGKQEIPVVDLTGNPKDTQAHPHQHKGHNSRKTIKGTKKDELANMKKGTGVGKKLFTPNKQLNTAGKVLQTRSSPTGFYINYHSPINLNSPPSLVGIDLPSWMPLMFRPTQAMHLNEIEVAIATYIFGTTNNDSFDGKETLITPLISLCLGYRSTLKTLLPKGLVDQDVLSLVACMLTYEQRSRSKYNSVWFLPTTFSQLALHWTTEPKTMMGYYQQSFMGKVDYLTKIFVPVNKDNIHWFLLVVDIVKGQLILLDSMPFLDKHDSRKRNIKKLGLFLEEMLQDESFYDYHITERPIISDFKLVEPKGIDQQRDDSNDCGVWVAYWMMQCSFSDSYNIQVDDGTRMRVALDLVLKPYNKDKDIVTKKALESLQMFHKKQRRLVKT